MKIPSPTPRRVNEPIGPLIDIVFLLLIFFMLVGAWQSPDLLPVKPPSSQTHHKPAAQQGIVMLAADGRLAFAGQMVDKKTLMERVKRRVARDPQMVIALEADATVASREVIAVLNTLRQAGVEHLSLLTVSHQSR